ncbi:hypothetical protein AC249_AIPGENE14792 [Exaiptasia diaphana]|nr:hypothetical protein AC249_AIPGENE14792 [Exaiptasia diaphana]
MSRRLRKNLDFLRVLANCNSKQRRAILKSADKELLKAICECVLNVVRGVVDIKPREKKRLARHKKDLRTLADKSNFTSIDKSPGTLAAMAKKMVLIPENSYLSSSVNPYQDIQTAPTVKAMSKLEKELSSLLSRKDLPDDEKMKLYEQIMQKYLEFNKQRHEEVEVTAPSQSPDTNTRSDPQKERQQIVEEEILDSIPRSSRSKAQRLLNRLKQNQNVLYFNTNGEMVYDGKPVSGTNIVDLIRDVMTDRKNFSPSNRELFSRGLARVNIPLDWIGNKNRKVAVQRYSVPRENNAGVFSPPSPPSSPTKQSRKSNKTSSVSKAARWLAY